MSEFTAAELLADADREARQLLGRTGPTDGPALAAGWPGILGAASQVLAVLPHHHGGPAHDDDTAFRVAVSRMVTEVRAIGHRPAGPAHPSVPRIIDTWAQAAAMLHRPSHPGNSHVAGPTPVRLRVAPHAGDRRPRHRPRAPGVHPADPAAATVAADRRRLDPDDCAA